MEKLEYVRPQSLYGKASLFTSPPPPPFMEKLEIIF